MVGKIRCRFPDGSRDLRHLGSFLRNQQEPRFQPYFAIQEKLCEEIKIDISTSVIENMVTKATFDLGLVHIPMSLQLGEVLITLSLLQEGTKRVKKNSISGFPRALALDLIQRSGNTSL